VISEARRAAASFELLDANGTVTKSGQAEALVGDEALTVGDVSVSYLDADVLTAHDYRVDLELWPGGRLALSQLGRRFDTFAKELRRVRNQARVSGLLAHGVTMPEVFQGAVLTRGEYRPCELQVYDTHVTVVAGDDDPWQLPLGAMSALGGRENPPAIVIETRDGLTTFGQLARRRDACVASIAERREAQRRLLAELTGQTLFADGWSVARGQIRDFDELVARFTAPERADCARTLLESASDSPRLGFVQLLDPDGDALRSPVALPDNWASFLLVPLANVVVLELLAGPAAATYAFRAPIDDVNRDLQLLHFRRAPLALTPEQAVLTPENPHRLALRRLAPLQRLRVATVGRVIHSGGWGEALRAVVTGSG
jgi:hypothetical protein